MSVELEAELPSGGRVGEELSFSFRLKGTTTEDVSSQTTYVWVVATEQSAADPSLKESVGVQNPAHEEYSEWQAVKWTPDHPGTYYVNVQIPSGPSKDGHITVDL